MKNLERLEALLASGGISGLSNDEALAAIGELVDLSHDLQREDGTERAIVWCEELGNRKPSPKMQSTLDYFHSNAWANKVGLRNRDQQAAWQWEQPEMERQVFLLRRALNSVGFDKLDTLVRCQILTNLGNQVNSLGRFVEAIQYWSRAIKLDPKFFMALGNRGYGLFEYGKSVYDPGHQLALIFAAHKDLTEALSLTLTHEVGYGNARPAFTSLKESIEARVDIAKLSAQIDLDGYELGETVEEQHYRKWCLRHRLFLNPLNDIGPHTIAARDILTLPDFTTAIDEPPSLIGFFNQMKQEFVSARWLYYEGTHSTGPHFSDSGVVLYNTLDYPTYGLSIEKTRIAYRLAYSLLDKIAFFMNDYLKLGMKPKQVSFRSIWREKENKPVREQLNKSENWPFRGLFWLSKDILEDAFQDVMEPEARELHEVRNHLEHKYLKLHEMLLPTSPAMPWATDSLAHSLRLSDFQTMTLHVLEIARAALIYLSLGMHREEEKKAKARGKGLVASMPLTTIEDEWKH